MYNKIKEIMENELNEKKICKLLEGCPMGINYVSKLTSDMILTVALIKPKYILAMDNIPSHIQLEILDKCQDIIYLIKNPCDEVQKKIIDMNDPHKLFFLRKITGMNRFRALAIDPTSIFRFDTTTDLDPTLLHTNPQCISKLKEVSIVSQSFLAINTPSRLKDIELNERVIELMISMNTRNLKYIKNISDTWLDYIAAKDPITFIKYTKRLTCQSLDIIYSSNQPELKVAIEARDFNMFPELCKVIIIDDDKTKIDILEKDFSLVNFIEAPKEYIKDRITRDPNLIEFMDNPDETLQNIVISDNPFNIRFINNPTNFIKLKTVRKVPALINEIKDQTTEVQLEILRTSPDLSIHFSNIVSSKVLDIICTECPEYLFDIELNNMNYAYIRTFHNDKIIYTKIGGPLDIYC